MEINNNKMNLVTRNRSLISLKNTMLMAGLLLAMSSQSVSAEERTIDISGSNSADSYLVYNSSISVPADDIVNAKINVRKERHGPTGRTIQATYISINLQRVLIRQVSMA